MSLNKRSIMKYANLQRAFAGVFILLILQFTFSCGGGGVESSQSDHAVADSTTAIEWDIEEGTEEVAESVDIMGSAPDEEIVASVEILRDGSTPIDTFGAYGYVVFTSRVEIERHKVFSDKFFHAIESTDGFKRSGFKGENVMPTYWKLADIDTAIKDSLFDYHLKNKNHEYFVSNYDYHFGKVISSSVGKTSVKGPLLVAFKKPYKRGELSEPRLVIDLSRLSITEFPAAISLWESKICENADTWTEDNSDLNTLEFISFINTHGNTLLSYIKPN